MQALGCASSKGQMGTEYTLASHQIPRGPSEVLSPGPGDSESIKSVIVLGIVYPMVLPADTYYNSALKTTGLP